MADDDKKPTGRAPRKRPAKKPAARPPATAATETGDSGPVPGSAGEAAAPDGAAEGSNREVVQVGPSDVMSELLDYAEWRIEESGSILGKLTVHYECRDVNYILDGLCASKIMSVFSGTADRFNTGDQMLPGASPMQNLWHVVGLDQVLGMTWFPGLSNGMPRTITVDPPATQDL